MRFQILSRGELDLEKLDKMRLKDHFVPKREIEIRDDLSTKQNNERMTFGTENNKIALVKISSKITVHR